MSPATVLILVIISLAISVILGAKFNHNIGLWAILFAYLIGTFGLGLKTSTLVNYWPLTFTFLIVSLSIFYGYAGKTGVLLIIAQKIIYANRRRTWMIPVMLYLISFGLCLAGCSTFAANALLAPIAFSVCISAGLNPMLAVAAIMIPAAIGSFAPWSLGASLPINYLMGTRWAAEAVTFQWYVWINGFIGSTLSFLVLFVLLRGWKAKNVEVEKPDSFNEEQKKVVWVIAIVAVIVIIPAFITLITGYKPKWFGYLDVQFIAVAGSLVFKLLKIGGDKAEKEIIGKSVPWSIIVMVTGVTMLMKVAAEGGAVNMVASAAASLPSWLVPTALAALGGFMSFFCGGMSVVTPMLLPLVEPLFVSMGLSPIWLITAITMGSNMTAVSPVSTGGSIVLGFVPDEKWREKMFVRQFYLAFYLLAAMAACSALGIFDIFHPATFG